MPAKYSVVPSTIFVVFLRTDFDRVYLKLPKIFRFSGYSEQLESSKLIKNWPGRFSTFFHYKKPHDERSHFWRHKHRYMRLTFRLSSILNKMTVDWKVDHQWVYQVRILVECIKFSIVVSVVYFSIAYVSICLFIDRERVSVFYILRRRWQICCRKPQSSIFKKWYWYRVITGESNTVDVEKCFFFRKAESMTTYM